MRETRRISDFNITAVACSANKYTDLSISCYVVSNGGSAGTGTRVPKTVPMSRGR